jgi:acyl dehydratase
MALIDRDTPIGLEFVAKPKTLSWHRIWTFSGGPFILEGWPKKNLHTDIEFARSLGLQTVGVSATQYLGHMAELMLDLFGKSWLSNGKMINVKFPRLVANGDVITSKAKVVKKERSGSAIKYTLEIYVENQNGDKVLAGSATGLILNT